MSDSIIIIAEVKTLAGGKGSVYYYAGNIYQPLEVHGSMVGKVKGAKRKFINENREMIKKDRAKQDYKNLLELFDEQTNKGGV